MSKLRKKTVYISDRGQPFYVEDMTPSHMINSITHHKQQIATLEWVIDNFRIGDGQKAEFLTERIELLTETVAVLVGELATRDPEEDPEASDEE